MAYIKPKLTLIETEALVKLLHPSNRRSAPGSGHSLLVLSDKDIPAVDRAFYKISGGIPNRYLPS